MVKLELFRGGKPVGKLPLQKTVTVGRKPSNTIQINQPEVSGLHAKIVSKEGRWVLQDLNSTNGTLVNGVAVMEHVLQNGDRVIIGDCTMVFSAVAERKVNYMQSEFTIMDQQASGDDEPAELQLAEYEQHVVHVPGPAHLGAWISGFFPVLKWAKEYDRSKAVKDLFAGITVAAMLVPQGMAYAMLAGMPPIYGLYASIIPLVIYALMGTSRQLSAGPAALDSLLVAAGVGTMAQYGSQSYIELALALTFMVGAIQFFMGMVRLGFLVNFLSHPVMTGFGAAAALIIAVSQLKHLLGVNLPQSNQVHVVIMAAVQQITSINPVTFALGVGSIVLMSLLKRWNRALPGALIAVVIATVAVWLFSLRELGVQTVGIVPSGLPMPGLPVFSAQTLQALFPVAFTLALVSFMEVVSVAKLYAAKNRYRINANQELLAIGSANIAGSLFKAFPISGGISRSAVNASAGAQTQVSSIVTALLIALTLTLLTPLFFYLPNAVLAAIIMSAVRGLIDIGQMRYLFRVRKTEGALLVLTLLATLFWDITFGLLAGIVASILLFIAMNSRPNMAVLGRLPGTQMYRNVENFADAEQLKDLIMLRIDASFYFANTEFLKEKLTEIAEKPCPPRAVLLDASAVNDLDSSADTTLQEIVQDYHRRGIEFYIAGVKHPVRAVMQRSGLYHLIGANHFFYTMQAAVQRFESKQEQDRNDLGKAAG